MLPPPWARIPGMTAWARLQPPQTLVITLRTNPIGCQLGERDQPALAPFPRRRRTVDQNVGRPSERVNDGSDELGLVGGRVVDVAVQPDRRSPDLGDPRQAFFEGAGQVGAAGDWLPTEQRHLRALRRQAYGDGLADASAGARDDGNLSRTTPSHT